MGMMHGTWIFWLIFNVFVLAMLALDLGVFHREKHVVGVREAIGWTAAWVGLAGLFAVLIYFFGHTMVGEPGRANSQLTLEFITGYIIEQSLSVDNLFVFLLIFRYFKVPQENQHVVLFWGVIGALVMRAIFIATGVTLLNRFHWIVYIFGAILIYSGVKLLRQHGADIHPEKNPLLRAFRKIFRMTENYEGRKFFVRRDALTLRHSARAGADRRRDYRPALRRRFHPRSSGCHARAIHCLHLKRFRHTGTALAVLRPGRNAGALSFAPLRAVDHPDFYWLEDAGSGLCRHPNGSGIRHRGNDPGGVFAALTGVSEETTLYESIA